MSLRWRTRRGGCPFAMCGPLIRPSFNSEMCCLRVAQFAVVAMPLPASVACSLHVLSHRLFCSVAVGRTKECEGDQR